MKINIIPIFTGTTFGAKLEIIDDTFESLSSPVVSLAISAAYSDDETTEAEIAFKLVDISSKTVFSGHQGKTLTFEITNFSSYIDMMDYFNARLVLFVNNQNVLSNFMTLNHKTYPSFDYKKVGFDSDFKNLIDVIMFYQTSFIDAGNKTYKDLKLKFSILDNTNNTYDTEQLEVQTLVNTIPMLTDELSKKLFKNLIILSYEIEFKNQLGEIVNTTYEFDEPVVIYNESSSEFMKSIDINLYDGYKMKFDNKYVLFHKYENNEFTISQINLINNEQLNFNHTLNDVHHYEIVQYEKNELLLICYQDSGTSFIILKSDSTYNVFDTSSYTLLNNNSDFSCLEDKGSFIQLHYLSSTSAMQSLIIPRYKNGEQKFISNKTSYNLFEKTFEKLLSVCIIDDSVLVVGKLAGSDINEMFKYVKANNEPPTTIYGTILDNFKFSASNRYNYMLNGGLTEIDIRQLINGAIPNTKNLKNSTQKTFEDTVFKPLMLSNYYVVAFEGSTINFVPYNRNSVWHNLSTYFYDSKVCTFEDEIIHYHNGVVYTINSLTKTISAFSVDVENLIYNNDYYLGFVSKNGNSKDFVFDKLNAYLPQKEVLGVELYYKTDTDLITTQKVELNHSVVKYNLANYANYPGELDLILKFEDDYQIFKDVNKIDEPTNLIYIQTSFSVELTTMIESDEVIYQTETGFISCTGDVEVSVNGGIKKKSAEVKANDRLKFYTKSLSTYGTTKTSIILDTGGIVTWRVITKTEPTNYSIKGFIHSAEQYPVENTIMYCIDKETDKVVGTTRCLANGSYELMNLQNKEYLVVGYKIIAPNKYRLMTKHLVAE